MDALTNSVIELAKEIVREPETVWGYSDVGDILIRYLKGEIHADVALVDLRSLKKDYTEERNK